MSFSQSFPLAFRKDLQMSTLWRRWESNPRPQSRERAASTSVAGALISPPARLAGGVVGGQLPKSVPGSAKADLAGLACYLIPAIPAAG